VYWWVLLHRPDGGKMGGHSPESLGIELSPEPFVQNSLRAVEHGHAEALFCLGDMAMSGSDGTMQDWAAAANFYKQAGERGHAAALCSLGAL